MSGGRRPNPSPKERERSDEPEVNVDGRVKVLYTGPPGWPPSIDPVDNLAVFRRGVLRAGPWLAVLALLGGCGPSNASLLPFDPAAAITATEAARSARFTIAMTVEIAGVTREVAGIEGVVDVVEAAGVRTGRLATNPFPAPGADPSLAAIETRTIDGVGFERTGAEVADGPWREVDGTLGSFLGLGNRGASFRAAVEELVEPVAQWSPVARKEVRGDATSRYAGVTAGPSGGPIEIWIDDLGRLRRMVISRAGVAPTNAAGVTIVELWDFGVEVDVERPESSQGRTSVASA